MCGIAGFITTDRLANNEKMCCMAKNMADSLIHRGPDEQGVWANRDAGVALAHRRLAILDTSTHGSQPMQSVCGRYILVYNGEIYNFVSLRKELEQCGFTFRGCSDTEVLLAAISHWGTEVAVKQLVGMYAFAVWDIQMQSLTLARDRIGEKPLYYGWKNNVFLFGSELKALRAHPAFHGQIDRGALSLLLRHNYIPAPYSIYQGIAKLSAGCLLSVSLQEQEPKIWSYWSGLEIAKSGVTNAFIGNVDQAVNELEVLLKNTICQQMVADVPLGAFLSGGVDSSVVVALMQAQSTCPVKTFSIGFQEEGYNEAEHARQVAMHLGTDHTELYVSAEQALAIVPRLPSLYDEPFSDSSQIPTFLLSQLAKGHVTVSLSGDAGDELFGGYNRYHFTAMFWQKLAAIPIPLRKMAARILSAVPPQAWNRVFKLINGIVPRSARLSLVGDKFHKASTVLASESADMLYHGLVSHWLDPAMVVIGGEEPPTLLTGKMPDLYGLNDIQRMMVLDILTYLPDDILTKLDRAAMAVSLETRIPFLDHRVVEFAWRLPQSMKLHNGQTKWALRQVLYRHVPKEIIERPKMGFGIPLGNWLRGSLRDWADALLDESRLKREGYFYPTPIRQKWKEHLSGKRNWQHHLWSVLMFQSWLENEKIIR